MDTNSFVLKGSVCYNTSPQEVRCVEGGYAVCVDGVSAGVFEQLPERFAALPLVDCGDQLIVPGMSDIHIHAPQYAFRGLGMDLELLDWLNTHTFPEEARYADPSYAERAYDIFASDLRRSPTTRAVVFGTMHVEATELLMDKLEATGLATYVGKVNMDRNGGENLEEDTAQSAADTRRWLSDVADRYDHTAPIITPRFTPSVTDELMAQLADIAREQHLPVQSHLSENPS
ncbi:amidohydrolase family protein [Parolsenella catena]